MKNEAVEMDIIRDLLKPLLPYCSLSEGEISPSPECALILEDETGVCGYALGLTDAKQAATKIQVITSRICSPEEEAKLLCHTISVCAFYCLLPPEGGARFRIRGLPLPDHCTSAATGR